MMNLDILIWARYSAIQLDIQVDSKIYLQLDKHKDRQLYRKKDSEIARKIDGQKDRQKGKHIDSQFRKKEDTHVDRIILFLKVQVEDKGEYICEAKNSVTHDLVSIHLHINYKPMVHANQYVVHSGEGAKVS